MEGNSTTFVNFVRAKLIDITQEGTVVPDADDYEGSPWNLCSWESCPEYSSSGEMLTTSAVIICTYAQSTAVQKFIPYFNRDGSVAYIQKIWIQSENVGAIDGKKPVPVSQTDFITDAAFQMAVLDYFGDLPSGVSSEDLNAPEDE